MGLFKTLKKLHDPGGIGKKLTPGIDKNIDKLAGKLDDVVKFDIENFKHGLRMFQEDPERAFLGAADPFSSKVWGKALGKEYKPIVNQYGGPSAEMYRNAIEKGIDIGPGATAHQIAQAVAAWYAGGALAQAAGGGSAAIGGGGAGAVAPAGAGGMGMSASQAATLARAGTTAAVGAADEELDPAIELELTRPSPLGSLRIGNVPGFRHGGLAQMYRRHQ